MNVVVKQGYIILGFKTLGLSLTFAASAYVQQSAQSTGAADLTEYPLLNYLLLHIV